MSDPQHPLVSTITASAFARVGVSKTFQRGETICREGDPGSVMLVHSGLVDVRSQIDETDVSVATLGSGRLIEDLTVMEGGIRSAMMVARTDVQLLLVDPLTMSDLLEREPGVALDVLRSMVDRLRSRAARTMASTQRSTSSFLTATSTLTLGKKSTTYSAPRYSSVWPF